MLMCDFFFPTKRSDHGEELSIHISSTHMHNKGQKDVSHPDMKSFKHFVISLSSQFPTP